MLSLGDVLQLWRGFLAQRDHRHFNTLAAGGLQH
jgi:hypothetical protein